MIGKSLQFLKQAAPKSRRVAVLDVKYIDATTTPAIQQRRAVTEAAARDLGVTLMPIDVNSASL